ncbi:hypothetical protein halTADL_0811 [Halohasta litchfieldiae]|uniref:DUF8052 domain-containing protein n=1 Tax=Halohasta litchfieldiae TaxID=1073996 RepID=A0A1H6V1N6_9EURY|nr:hypothetical protein [Halohasta litchfieldiae]ATW87609.1 hypothetical protein halTADL_0811 [Halohasta litchfieldiae]SEI97796.1 hypothetical protein SAMN05444271_11466 [Halohasta litchfieldiae]
MSRDAEELPAAIRESVPEFDDEYLDRVAGRLLYNYDLQKDYTLHGEQWALYGEMRVKSQKQFFHPALSYGDHESEEYLLVRRSDHPTVDELNRLVDLGHDLADEWITADEEHYGTDITFILISEEIPDAVVDYVEGFRDRTLLKFGYYGHYDVNLVVVAPDAEQSVASEVADVAAAFQLWDDVSTPDEGVLSRFAKRFWQ